MFARVSRRERFPDSLLSTTGRCPHWPKPDRLPDDHLEPHERAALVERLAAYAAAAVEKAEKLRKNLAYAERLVQALHAELETERETERGRLSTSNRPH